MPSEASRKKAEEIIATPGPWEKAWGVYNRAVAGLAAALDEAEKRGAERERWECYRTVCTATNSEHAARLIAARGPMCGPEPDVPAPEACPECERVGCECCSRGPMRGPEEICPGCGEPLEDDISLGTVFAVMSPTCCARAARRRSEKEE